MAKVRSGAWRRRLAVGLGILVLLVAIALLVWRNDILQSLLNP
jgi:hypothetical protein